MKKLVRPCFFAIVFFFFVFQGNIFAQSGIYDRIGIIVEHGLHGAVPEENLDLFTGNLTLRFLDINLPGPNGLDLRIWRVYNSKILKDRISGGAWGIQQEPYSWVGMGWSMHMGRVHYYNLLPTVMPVIEFPDGRWETAWLSTDSSCCYTRDFLKYDQNNYKLYFKDGTVWTFGQIGTISYIGSTEQVRLVTKIENSYGQHIDITYQSGGSVVVSKITDSLGREVNFVTTGTTPKLDHIYVKDAQGNTQNYYYTVGSFPYGGYYQLTSYAPPAIPAATYEYYNGQSSHYELTKVNTSYGGSMSYAYADQTFYFYVNSLATRVVTQKKLKFSASGSEYTWNYNYPSYQNTGTGTVNVQGPVFNTDVTYNAYTATTPWQVGLLQGKVLTDGSYSEQYVWTSQVLSNKHWYVLNIDMGPGTAPLLSSISRTPKGDASSKDEYLYERAAVKACGLPTRINRYGNPGSLKNYKALTYFFESNSTFASKYMVSYPSDEKDYNSSGTLLKETQTSYLDYPAGSCGAINWIKRLKSSGTFLTWNYTYTSSNPNLITITVDLPGSAGIETYEYRYGVLSKIVRPGFTELTRTISQYESSILTETNQHGGTMSFTYDGLSRIKQIAMPSGFNAVTATWSANSVSITQGNNTVVKYWDGLGRNTGSTESGDGTTLYCLKTLDAEGRLTAESKGSTSSSDIYSYVLTALGQITKITDPRGKITSITYSSNTKTVTDAQSHATVFTYNDLPGLATAVKDALNLTASSTFDALGRLTQVIYNSARTQSYTYDGLDNVTGETHPETGSITYAYNTENNLSQKTWGGVTLNYSYNSSNQLTSLNAGDETITYGYDTNGRVNSISSTNNWSRSSITYNALGSVTGEIQAIPGLTSKTLNYAYDGNNNQSILTYPDGKQASITNNGLNMPKTVGFNAKSLISAITYGYAKQPTAITISGNSTSLAASYDVSGQLATAALNKGGNVLYNASYTYDGVGNITAISNTTPQLNGTYGYDPVYRLTAASYSPAGIGRVDNFSYAYDSYGNMTTVTENNIAIFNATYTSANQISGFTYDNRGNLTADGAYLYVWDNQNRLSTLNNSSGQVLATYLYNERGLRLKALRNAMLANKMNARQEGTTIANGESRESSAGAANVYAAPDRSSREKTASAIFGTSSEKSIIVEFPKGNDKLQAGSKQSILWASDENIKEVKLEYSADNGSTYRAIADRAPNTGRYEWELPHDVLSSCLMRISEADGQAALPDAYSFELDFKISGHSALIRAGQAPDFLVRLLVPDRRMPSYQRVAVLSLAPDSSTGKEKVSLNYQAGDAQDLASFLERWHHLAIEIDMKNYSGSLWIDDRLISENIPLFTRYSQDRSAEVLLSGCQNVPGTIWLDNVKCGIHEQSQTALNSLGGAPLLPTPVSIDDFEAYAAGESPQNSGWLTENDFLPNRQGGILKENGNTYLIDNREALSGGQSFKLESRFGWPLVAAKSFGLPDRVPFGISDGTFKIEYMSGPEDDGQTDGGKKIDRIQNRPKQKDKKGLLDSAGADPYYIYSFDGKLLAEYDDSGNCLSDYIYAGNRLVAEYRPQENKYYYYTSDQISSTRMITDDAGAVVYSATFDPFGGMQKTWVSTYDPTLKFSGKEREASSEMDYFGARYYAHTRYRWISPDPVVNQAGAMFNPQKWNFYSYCVNNPITLCDPDGRILLTTALDMMQQIAGDAASRISIANGMLDVSGLTQEVIANNEGALLLYQLATSEYTYSYSEGTTVNTAGGVMPVNGEANLNNRPDWRTWGKPKSPSSLPPSGIDDIVVLDPSISHVDKATGTKTVSKPAWAFHELAEAYGIVDLGMQPYPKGGGPGAHAYAGQRERTLINQRPGFTQCPAGGKLVRR